MYEFYDEVSKFIENLEIIIHEDNTTMKDVT